ncbi:riboflavin biosynthesis protein RibD [Bacteroidia bacterium]|nr:riboflavin biosynthesis protein RibD [Bacteroidia bacterium]
MDRSSDEIYMRRAMALAEKGKGFVNPNPLVGAVIVKNDEVIAEGWHEYFGGSHAERNAIKNIENSGKDWTVAGSTMYVTLEPCCHHGKTPPCTEAIIEKGVARVVVGLTDPNPKVAGKGIEQLRKAGLEVVTGVCQEEIKQQNRVFLKYITTQRPWVVMKTAMTLDGKIATGNGDSKWVSGEKSRYRVQAMRAEYMGVMVGIGTVRQDNPMLNVRMIEGARQPIRIIADSRASIPPDSQVCQTAAKQATFIAHTDMAEAEQLESLHKLGVETILCEQIWKKEGKGEQVNLNDLMLKLGVRGIDSILLEGGGELNFSFLEQHLVDEVVAFIAPKYIGGRDAKTPVEGCGWERMADAMTLKDVSVERIGEDIVVHGYPHLSGYCN